MTPPPGLRPEGRVAVIGGGLAGMAAAAALRRLGIDVVLFEARRQLGGRAVSFTDPASGRQIDHCQHVALGCCTNLVDLFERCGLAGRLVRQRQLDFLDRSGRRHALRAAPGLPAPFHLAPSLARLGYLTWRERGAIARALFDLMRHDPRDDELTVRQWLARRNQSPRAVEQFWGLVLESALGESLDRAGWRYARKVFVDAFLAHRQAYQMLVPTESLACLLDGGLRDWLCRQGVDVRSATPVARLEPLARGTAGETQNGSAPEWLAAGPRFRVVLVDGQSEPCAAAVVAVTWRQIAGLLDETLLSALPPNCAAGSLRGAPISGVHLWFDRPLTSLAHAVLVGRLSQWVFCRRDARPAPAAPGGPPPRAEHYYQVVISASYALESRPRQETVDEVCRDLAAVFPAARQARLLRWRLVTEREAVFSPAPNVDRLRPPQMTASEGLWLAGDWTATGWPATMEGAVRSGYLAAEGLAHQIGRPQRVLVDDLPRGWLSRRLLGPA